MKNLVILSAVAAAMLCSCVKDESHSESPAEYGNTGDEKIYTEDELGVIVEWVRRGWDEVHNETDETVTLITTYPFNLHDDVTSAIEPEKSIKLDAGAAVPGISLQECNTATIRLSDGTEILCTPGAVDKWSRHFFGNYEEWKDYEVVKLDGKNLRHDLWIRAYHIDKTLVELWLAGQ